MNQLTLPETIATTRLLLRPWQPTDAPTLLTLLQTERPRLLRDFPRTLASVTDQPTATSFIAQRAVGWIGATDFQYSLWDATTPHRCLGMVSLRDMSWSPLAAAKAELAYYLIAEAEGQGFMREAMTAVLATAFQHLPLAKCFALVKPDNERSQRLLRHLGFRHGGRLRNESRAGGANGPLTDADYFDLLPGELTPPA